MAPGSKNIPSAPTKELRRLVDGLFADSLSRVEFARLEELLENDPESRRYYLEIASNEALIPVAASGLKLEESAVSRRPKRWVRVAAGIGAVAALIMAYAIGVSRSLPDEESGDGLISQASGVLDDGLVRLTGGVGVAWEKGDPAAGLAFGSPLPGSKVSIESGLLELTYANGVSVLLEGPARYEVTGSNSGSLEFGNLVAEVPPGAEGFTVDYAGDRVVDHGTQFGLRLPKETGIPEVAVFRGEVEVFSGEKEIAARLTRDHAVRRSSREEGELESIPLDRSAYARELPSRELPWRMPAVGIGETTRLEFDVSDLVRKPGDYLFIFKWMKGRDDLHLKDVELRLDGALVAADAHQSVTGDYLRTKDNAYEISVSDSQFRPGRWILSATGWCPEVVGDGRVCESEGVLLTEEGGLVGIAELDDCIGHWEYWHDGLLWVRHLFPNGSFHLYRDGQLKSRGLWEARNGGLLMFFSKEGIYERHILRDENTLIFIDRPYRNAIRK